MTRETEDVSSGVLCVDGTRHPPILLGLLDKVFDEFTQ